MKPLPGFCRFKKHINLYIIFLYYRSTLDKTLILIETIAVKKAMLRPAKTRLTTKKITDYLKVQGIELSEKNAEEVLDLLFFLAKLIVKQNLKK